MRTNAVAVAAILGDQYDSSKSLEPFIHTASVLTDWLQAQDARGQLSSATLQEIETYLAAHFYAHSDPFYQSKSIGGASGTFQGQTAMALSATFYGQTAMVLDITGTLAKRSQEAVSGTKRTAGITYLGLRPSQQTDYVDRD